MSRLLTVLSLFAITLFAGTASAADKHTTSHYISGQIDGLMSSFWEPAIKLEAEATGDIQGPMVCLFDRVEGPPVDPFRSYPKRYNSLSGLGEIDCCNLGKLTTCDQVALIPICAPCIYLWVGTHYIHDAAFEGFVNGDLHSMGVLLLNRDGNWVLNADFYGYVVVRERPSLPQEGPGFGE